MARPLPWTSLCPVLVLLPACTLVSFTPPPCSDNLECRDAFGLGSVCSSDGLCEAVQLPQRCQQTYPNDLTFPVDPDETLLIGSVFDHTLDTHTGRYQSAQLALMQANATDGLEGRSFAIVHCSNEEAPETDGLSKDEATLQVAGWLADEVGVSAIVGPAASGRTEAVYTEIAVDHDVLVISPSATSPALTELDGVVATPEDPGLLWRTAPPDDLQSQVIAEDMAFNFNPDNPSVFRSTPSLNVGVLYQQGAYGEGLERGFSTALAELKGRTTLFPFFDDTSRSEAIALSANQPFDEILFISSDAADIVAFFQGAMTLDQYEDMPLFLTDAARNADVLQQVAKIAPDLMPHVRGTAPANPTGAVYDSFAVSYGSEFDNNDVSVLSFTAQAFDAGWLMVYAHAWALYQGEGLSGTDLARGLLQVSSGPQVEIRAANWPTVRERFAAGDPVDVFGASGPLDYDERGETSAPIEVWIFDEDGSDFVVTETVSP